MISTNQVTSFEFRIVPYTAWFQYLRQLYSRDMGVEVLHIVTLHTSITNNGMHGAAGLEGPNN